MDPNSQHQRWSLWEYHAYPDGTKRPDFPTVKANAARFARLLFGSASEMSIRYATDGDARPFWEFKILSEGHPVHDPRYTEWVHRQWRTFLAHGFGPRCEVRCHARLAAGDRQDGRPPDQLIILPRLETADGERDLPEGQAGLHQ